MQDCFCGAFIHSPAMYVVGFLFPIIIIIITRPKPAYGRQGLAGCSLPSSGAQFGSRKWWYFVTDTHTFHHNIYHHHHPHHRHCHHHIHHVSTTRFKLWSRVWSHLQDVCLIFHNHHHHYGGRPPPPLLIEKLKRAAVKGGKAVKWAKCAKSF